MLQPTPTVTAWTLSLSLREPTPTVNDPLQPNLLRQARRASLQTRKSGTLIEMRGPLLAVRCAVRRPGQLRGGPERPELAVAFLDEIRGPALLGGPPLVPLP
jgi:hypothetical protein